MIGNAITAIRAGYVLADAARTKNHQMFITAAVTLMTIAVAFLRSRGYDLPISDAVLVDLAHGVWGLLGVYNIWATAATSEKVGVRSKADPDPPPDEPRRPVDVRPAVKSDPDWTLDRNFPGA
jgi:hypothetical protein